MANLAKYWLLGLKNSIHIKKGGFSGRQTRLSPRAPLFQRCRESSPMRVWQLVFAFYVKKIKSLFLPRITFKLWSKSYATLMCNWRPIWNQMISNNSQCKNDFHAEANSRKKEKLNLLSANSFCIACVKYRSSFLRVHFGHLNSNIHLCIKKDKCNTKDRRAPKSAWPVALLH